MEMMTATIRIWFDAVEPRVIFIILLHMFFKISFSVTLGDTYFLGLAFVVVATGPPMTRYIAISPRVVLLHSFFHVIKRDSPDFVPRIIV